MLYRDDNTPMSEQTLRSWVAAAQRKANLRDNGGKHILRHTFCSHLAMRGASVMDIQRLAGHRQLSTTMRYMHLSPEHLDQAIGLLGRGRIEDIGRITAPAPGNTTGERGGAVAANSDRTKITSNIN